MLDFNDELRPEFGIRLYRILNDYTNSFKVDLDGYSWKRVSEIIRNLCKTMTVEDIAVTRDTYKNKHYHIYVTLASQVPIYFTLVLRHLCHDDGRRIALDCTRLLSGNLEDFDWLATAKGSIYNGQFTNETARYICKPQRYITPLMVSPERKRP